MYNCSTIQDLLEFFYDHCNEHTENGQVSIQIGEERFGIKALWIESDNDSEECDVEGNYEVVLEAKV